MNKVILGDCLEKLKELEDNSVDSIVTDPPYELGFMGKSWDSTGIANNKDMWAECLRVLKPGGHLLAFSGTRTYHRMAVAIEDAGFEVRDMIEWVYSTGFPKSLNIGKAVSKIMGEEVKQGTAFKTAGEYGGRNLKDPTPINEREQFRHKPTTEEGKQWEGWGTALKPAHEPICMARKPLSEKTVAENCLKWGTGGINIDESRVGTEYYLQGNDLSDIIEVCQLNHLKLSANNAEKQKFQEDTTSLIKKMYSVLVSVDIPILEKALGKLREDISIMDILCSEGMWEENMSIYLNTDLSGKEQTEKYLKDLKYIISMVKKMITDWKISNSLISLLIESLLTQVKKLKTINEGQARFPANFIHDNSEEVRECFPETKSGKLKSDCYEKDRENNSMFAGGENFTHKGYDADSGNASRFFKSIENDPLQEWAEKEVAEHRKEIIEDLKKEYGFIRGKSIIYQAKASKSERNRGCEGLYILKDNTPKEDIDEIKHLLSI